MAYDTCPICGDKLYTIEGLYLDRDGIRNARYCDGCGTVFKTAAHGYCKYKRMIDFYAPKGKDRIINGLKKVIAELEGK